MSNANTIIEKLNQLHTEFKTTTDKVDAMGVRVDGLDVEKQNRMLTDVEALQKQVDALALAAQRGGMPAGQETEQKAAEQKAALNGFLRKGHGGLTADEIKTLSTTGNSGADGGVTIPENIAPGIISERNALSPIRGLARKASTATGKLEFLISKPGFGAAWVAEEAARPQTPNGSFAKSEIAVHEIYAMPHATRVILEDAGVDLVSWLQSEVAYELASKESQAFLHGDGVGKPYGLITRANAVQSFTNPKLMTTATAGVLNVDDVINLVHSLKSEYRKAGSFLAESDTIRTLRMLKDANGQYLWQPSIQAGETATLLGRPLVENGDVALNGAAALVFGDIAKAYVVLDHVAPFIVMRDEITTPGYTKFYFRTRVGGDVVNGFAASVLAIKA